MDIRNTQNRNSFLGLRIQGSYPDRVDAIFNLENGNVRGVKKAGGFSNELAFIEALGNGYYKCTLSGNINASEVKILIGSTSIENKVLSWEAKSNNVNGLILIPSTLKLELNRNWFNGKEISTRQRQKGFS